MRQEGQESTMAEFPRYLKVYLLLATVHMPLTLGHFNVTNQNNTSNKCLETGRYFQNTVIAFWKKKNGENNPLLVIYFEKKKNVLTMRHYIELKNQPNVK